MQSIGTCVLVALSLLAFIGAAFGGGTLVTGPKIVGYWGCSPGGHSSTLEGLQTGVNKGYTVIIFAFYDVNANGTIYSDPGAVATPTKASISTTKTFTYLVSLFGGQNGQGPNLVMTSDAWAQAMFNSFVNLHTMYGFDGIDIDLENSWGTTANEVLCGLRTFFKLIHNAGYVVSMAPQTTAVYPGVSIYQAGNWNSYVPLMDSSMIEYVDIVAIQMYNNNVPGNDVAAYTDSLTTGFQVSGYPTCDGVTGFAQIPACKLAHGWPSTQGAAPSGCPGLAFTSSDHCPYGSALSNYYDSTPSLKATAGMMTWSVEWDESAGWPFITSATTISFGGTSCSNTPSTNSPGTGKGTSAPTISSATVKPTNSPSTQSPSTHSPTNSPATAHPTNSPSTNSPSTNSPSTHSPSTNSPSTNSPSTNSPSTKSPSTNSPSTHSPPTVKPISASTPDPISQIKTGSATTLTSSLCVSVIVSILYLLV